MNTTVRENRNDERAQMEQFVAPVSSVIEDGDGYMLQVEMPGVNKEGLEISVENNELTILGTPLLAYDRWHFNPSRVAPGEFPAYFRARSFDRPRQNQREDRARRCDFNSAEGRAGQAA